MHSSENVYRHSGIMGAGPAAMLVAGMATAAVLGIVYGFLNVWNPLLYVQFFATWGYALALGWMVGRAGIASKCRSPLMAAVSGTVVGVAGLYVAWASFMFALVQKFGSPGAGFSLLSCLMSPLGVLSFVPTLAGAGWFNLFGWTPTGVALYAFWLVEAGMIVGGSVMYAKAELDKRVFCESCNGWCEVKPDVARAELQILPKLQQALGEGDLAALVDVPPPAAGDRSYLRVDQHLCPACGNMGTYKVVRYELELNKDGKEETKETDFTPHVLLTASNIVHLGELVARGKIQKIRRPAKDAPRSSAAESDAATEPPQES
ncbi:MAG: hypothetical protein HS116_27180 [Planctomycetes bacterium]|nr:hypothetical protein [Planctomycetota bacterium]